MRSVRATLIMWFVVILTVVLCLFGVLFYVNVSSNLIHDVDRTLALQADGVAETVFAFWRAERAAAGSGPGNWLAAPSETFDGGIEQGDLSALLSRWAEKTGNLNTGRPIRLVDTNGHPFGASDSFTQLALPLTDTVIAEARAGRTSYETFSRSDHRIRLVTRPALRTQRPLYSVQVVASLQDMDASLARLRLLLLVLIPLMLSVTGALGAFLASTALGPIGKLAARAQEFMAECFHERIDMPRTQDEFEQLDVTWNEMLVRLEHAFSRLRQFSAAASHELRTPLTVMKGEIGLALRRPRSTEEYRHVLKTQLVAIDEMTSTVEELLMLARSEAAEAGGEWCPINLSALVRKMGDTFTTIAKAKAIQVEVSVNGPVWVRGEQRLLERLVSNLLDNAIKHTPSKSLVNILTDHQDGQARVIVHDTGPGIPPEHVPHLFDQFFKRRPIVSNRTGSIGLGLGLCRWIAETHHGRIDVASTPGQGTTFTVTLPVVPLPA